MQLTPKDWTVIVSGKQTIYIFGDISYKDIFGDSWNTKFRYMLEKGSAFKNPCVCSEGNEAT